MKIPPRNLDGFVKKPDAAALAVLVYGPDEGLVRERLDLLAKTVVADIRDPFNVAEITASALNENPSRLLDEAQSISMLGGRRVVRLRDAADSCAGILKDVLAALRAGDNFILVEAGELGPRSTLRSLFENATNAAAVPCYVDDARDIGRVIGDALRAAGFTIAADGLSYMAAHVTGDRAVARSEVEKLITYMGAEKKVTLDDVVACVGNAAALSLDDLAKFVASGQFAEADRILEHVLSEGIPAVTVLRNLQNHFTKLHITKTRIQQGESAEAAMAKIKPPLFFKVKPAFTAQLNGWSLAQMEQALNVLATAEAKSKQTANDPHTLCSRAILSLAQVGARAVRRG